MLHNDTLTFQEKAISFETVLFIDNASEDTEFFVLPTSRTTAYVLLVVTGEQEALEMLQDVIPNLILLDHRLPEIEKLVLTHLIHSIREQKDVSVVALSKDTRSENRSETSTDNATGFRRLVEIKHFLTAMKYALA